MNHFSSDHLSSDKENEKIIGEHVLSALLNSRVDSIIELNLCGNRLWFFSNSDTKEEILGNVSLLVDLISKQAGLQYIDLNENSFSSNATKSILTRIGDHPSILG